MLYFAQFYQTSTGYIAGTIPPQFSKDAKRPIPACGTDSVYRLDGRFSSARMHAVAADVAKRRGFIGYRIMVGERRSDAKPRGNYVDVSQLTDLQTISAAINARR